MSRTGYFAVFFVAVVIIAGRGLGSGAQEALQIRNGTPGPVEATTEALGVPADCVLQALGTPTGSVPSPVTMPQTMATVELFDIGYAPCALTIPAGVPVVLTLTNRGTAAGNFIIDELGVRSDVPPDETRTVEMIAPPGIYVFYSDIPGHREAGQAGILTVADAGTPAAGTPTP